MTIDNLLAELGQKMGLPGLKLDDRGLCRLVFDQTIIVDIERDDAERCIHLYSVVGSVPGTGREALYSQMLAANLFGAETGGAALSIDPASGDIVLCRRIIAESLPLADFVGVIENLVNHAETWSKRLASGAPAPAMPESLPDREVFSMSAMIRA